METIRDFLDSIYSDYQVFAFRGGQIVRGKLHAVCDDVMVQVKNQIEALGWLYSFEDIDGEQYLNCTVVEKPATTRVGLHLLLFLTTIFTTLLIGGDFGIGRIHLVIIDLLSNLIAASIAFFKDIPNATPAYWLHHAFLNLDTIGETMLRGLPFSAAILIILGSHEMGHYTMARRYGMNVSLPYFIPVPFGIGTLGAIIKIKSPLVHRRAILDVGAAGPLTGTVLSIFFLIVGLAGTRLVPQNALGYFPILGDSLLTSGLKWLFFGDIPAGYTVAPTAFFLAGWIGLLITSINLLPIGQLDGGHVAYALFGSFQQKLAAAAFGMLAVLGGLGALSLFSRAGNPEFLPWLLCAVFLRSFMKPAHPPALDENITLNRPRKLVAVLCIIILVCGFVPTPILG